LDDCGEARTTAWFRWDREKFGLAKLMMVLLQLALVHVIRRQVVCMRLLPGRLHNLITLAHLPRLFAQGQNGCWTGSRCRNRIKLFYFNLEQAV
jgi:hypothetical protein